MSFQSEVSVYPHDQTYCFLLVDGDNYILNKVILGKKIISPSKTFSTIPSYSINSINSKSIKTIFLFNIFFIIHIIAVIKIRIKSYYAHINVVLINSATKELNYFNADGILVDQIRYPLIITQLT